MGATGFYRTIQKDWYIAYEPDVKEKGGTAYEFFTYQSFDIFNIEMCAQYASDPIDGSDDLMLISLDEYMVALSAVLKNKD